MSGRDELEGVSAAIARPGDGPPVVVMHLPAKRVEPGDCIRYVMHAEVPTVVEQIWLSPDCRNALMLADFAPEGVWAFPKDAEFSLTLQNISKKPVRVVGAVLGQELGASHAAG